jgi:hypothetical protein
MPNWCNNVVTIKHKNKKALDRVVKAFNEEKLCAEFIPIPKELEESTAPNDSPSKDELIKKYGYPDWYQFCVNEWGTKWDVSPYGTSAQVTGNKVCLGFDTAWSPPTGLYDKLVEEGYEVDALYFEVGGGFYGRYSNGEDECAEFGSSKDIPDWIDEAFNVRESMLEYEKENE